VGDEESRNRNRTNVVYKKITEITGITEMKCLKAFNPN
jgi:hypothetical protein